MRASLPCLWLLLASTAAAAPRERAVLVPLDADLRMGEAPDAPVFRTAGKDAPDGQFRFVRAAGDLVELATYAEVAEPDRCAERMAFHPALELHFFVSVKQLRTTVSAPETTSYRDGSKVTVYPGAVLLPLEAAEAPAARGRMSFRLHPPDRLAEIVAVRSQAITTVFTPRALPDAEAGALGGPLTLAVAGRKVELRDDEVLPLIRQPKKGGKLRVTLRGRCVVVETAVPMLLLGGLAGRGTGGELIPVHPVEAGTKLFFENGQPAGEVKKAVDPMLRLPDGRRCFDVTAPLPAEHDPGKLRVCTAR